jgi:hypothetical protein
MSLSKFSDDVFLNYKGNGFVWEEDWESFRPVESVRWTGKVFEIDDRIYTRDPTDPLYGYGTPQMKEICAALTAKYADEVPNAVVVPTPAIGKVTWFMDREVALSPCAPRDRVSWKTMCKGRTRTLRKAPRNKHTIRNIV